MRVHHLAAIIALALGCRGGTGAVSPPAGMSVASITVTSSSILPNAPVPIEYTCDGKDLFPALTWSAPPPGTRSIAIVVDDPDAPGGTFTHFIAFDLPSDLRAVKEGSDLPALGGRIGRNDFDRVAYSGPCPPRGEEHRYLFKVLALDQLLTVAEGIPRAEIDAAMNGHLLGEGALTSTFGH